MLPSVDAVVSEPAMMASAESEMTVSGGGLSASLPSSLLCTGLSADRIADLCGKAYQPVEEIFPARALLEPLGAAFHAHSLEVLRL